MPAAARGRISIVKVNRHFDLTVVEGDWEIAEILTMSSDEVETPGVCGGAPCVGDTRVRVGLVVQAFKETQDIRRTAERFDLTDEQVRAALDYYETHRERVNGDIRRNRLLRHNNLTFKAYKEGDQYVSECVELGVTSCGDTLDEAFGAITDAATLYLDTLADLADPAETECV